MKFSHLKKCLHSSLCAIIIFLSSFTLPVCGHVKSILSHGVTAPEALTAKYYHKHLHEAGKTPHCAKLEANLKLGSHHGHGSTFCFYDEDYPLDEIQHAIKYHYHAVASMYKDVLVNTDLSVDRLATLEQEGQFLCKAHVEYGRPKRALNTRGEWSIIVNDIPASYDQLTQTARVEKCLYDGQPCPYVPECYLSKCIQKYTYQRFLVYNPKDYYYPFRVESFKLPSSCDCVNGELYYDEHAHEAVGAVLHHHHHEKQPYEHNHVADGHHVGDEKKNHLHHLTKKSKHHHLKKHLSDIYREDVTPVYHEKHKG